MIETSQSKNININHTNVIYHKRNVIMYSIILWRKKTSVFLFHKVVFFAGAPNPKQHLLKEYYVSCNRKDR